MRRNFCCIGFFFLALLPLYGLTVEEAFEKGNQAYVRGENALNDARKKSGPDKEFQIETAEREFQEALGSFQSCLEKAESAALHYNLGNSFFKLGLAGHAIYHFRRAQELDPSSEEIRANLAFVRKAAGFPELQASLYDKTLGRRPVDFWMWMLAGGFWLGVTLLVFPRMYGLGGAVIPIVGCAVLLFSFVPLWAVLQAGKFRNQAIVLDADTALLVSPTEDSAAAAFLQSGEAVTIQPAKKQPHHFFVSSDDGEEGWVFSKHLGRIRE
ncbi:MAG: tetratricopeptide repeat protein [Opitutae bacterium]|jgi:tetratricopeptide (TPR) repeat protein|nr:tetratricopeptide repeat protein [Opitutae bacterium]MBT7854522.1 tetratricopeptide repeat protein [Opitutae bacterium]